LRFTARLAGGVTTANLLHGSANSDRRTKRGRQIQIRSPGRRISDSGRAAGNQIRARRKPEALGFQSRARTNAALSAHQNGRLEVIRDAFLRARDYKKSWDDFRAKKTNRVQPRRDLELEPLVEILEGKRLVHAHGYRSDEHLNLLLLADEFGFKVATLQHALEAYKIAPEIAKRGTAASIFADSGATNSKPTIRFRITPRFCGKTASTFRSIPIRTKECAVLNLDAAKMMKYGGVPEEEALENDYA
jgi:hypothetical protein